MPFFRSKPKVVDAVQFVDAGSPPRGVHVFVADSGYKHAFVIASQGRQVSVVVGDWIVDEGDHLHYYPIDDETFKGPRGYDPL